MVAAESPIAVAGASRSAPPTQESRSAWPDLLPELLLLVLLRVPSHADRVRVRAVCRPWRSAARDLPPLLPWLALRDGTFLSLPDGVVHRLPAIPATNVANCVSTGGMLFLVHHDASCSLMNPLTGETTPQHIDYDILWFQMSISNPFYLVADNFRKIVVSDNIVALYIKNRAQLHIFARGPRPQAGAIKLDPRTPHDIALFKGKLYMLLTDRTWTDGHWITRHRELHVLDLRSGLQHDHQPSAQCCIPGTTTDWWSTGVYKRYYYLVVSGDRLLMVEREIEVDRVSHKRIRTRWLKVFEAMDLDLDCGHGRWRKVDRLKGHALFVSLDCSFSLPAGIGAQEDCVYFVRELKLSTHPTCEVKAEDDHLCCGVYNIRDQTVAPLPTEMLAMTAVSHAGPWSLTWFPLPPN